jgi:alpha-mannosidase
VITKKINDSQLKQRVILRKDGRRLDFETEVDWKETHRFLKTHFYPNIHTEEIASEIQFGYAKRPTHRNKQYDRDRYEACQHKWSALCEAKRGFAILNDCKYGIAAEGNNMSLTLMNGAACPDLSADRGVHTLTYSIMPFTENLADSDVVRAGYELNAPVLMGCGAAEEKSLLYVSEKNVIIDNIKLAEDGSGDLIIRLYESQNSYTNAKLSFGFDVKSVCVTNMLEEGCDALSVEDNTVDVALHGFGILTLRVKR